MTRTHHFRILLPLFMSVTGAGCGAAGPAGRELEVTGNDYSFQAPDSLPPGPVTIKFRNAGQVPHEMVVGLLKPEISLARALELMRGGVRPDSVLEGFVGILVAGPGTTALGTLGVDLAPGRSYALVCGLQDGPDKPPHVALGMTRELRVSR